MIGHSSGTTGTPKAVRFDHQGFIFGVKQEVSRMVGRRIMTALPHSHASALSILMSALIRGDSHGDELQRVDWVRLLLMDNAGNTGGYATRAGLLYKTQTSDDAAPRSVECTLVQ